jgi:uncharacterized protein
MRQEESIKMTEEFVRQNMTGFDSGHDWWHIDRVRRVAIYINKEEKNADMFALEIAALLHDIADSKFTGSDKENRYLRIGEFMTAAGLNGIKQHVLEIIKNVSFSTINPSGDLTDPVLLTIQDADRLDAIGAIGIARAFNYGGFRNNSIYVPEANADIMLPSTIKHFYDKLLRLKDLMNTPTGRRLAEERHVILISFLEQFYKEWNFGIVKKD